MRSKLCSQAKKKKKPLGTQVWRQKEKTKKTSVSLVPLLCYKYEKGIASAVDAYRSQGTEVLFSNHRPHKTPSHLRSAEGYTQVVVGYTCPSL